MLYPSGIELTDRDELDVKEKIITDKLNDYWFVKDAFNEMPQDIGTRWHNALKAREGLPLIEAFEDAIYHLAKENGTYDQYVEDKKREIIEDLEERIHRRASNE